MTHGFSRPWAAAYLHRAVQLARDETAVPEQADLSVSAVTRLLTGPIDPGEARAGAEAAPGDVRTLPSGAKEWILLSAANYRNASAAVNAQSPLAERRNLIEELNRLVVVSPRDTGAAALVKRMSDNWRVPLPSASTVSTEPRIPTDAAPQEITPVELSPVDLGPPTMVPPNPLPAAALPVVSPVVPPVAIPAPAADGSLPTPDPAWLRVIASHAPGRVTKGATNIPGTTEHLRRETWSSIAQWMQALTVDVMGADWFAEPHRNWQNSGYLTGYYWAKIFPKVGDYGTLFNVGVQIAHRVQWANELDDSLSAVGSGPLLALWVTTNDNAIARLQQTDPDRLQRYRRAYRVEMDRAFREWPELWLEGGALVRWYRRGPGKRVVSRLVPARQYRAEVEAGRLRPDECEPDIWSPLLSLEEAIADPGRAAAFIARYLSPFGAILRATYQEMASMDR